MRNQYHAPEVIEVGEAKNLVLGGKWFAACVDAVLGIGWYFWPFEDIDEGDE